jgi:multidrug resistance efflux pump
LIARHVEIGDGVLPGKVLMTLSPKGVMQLVVQIDEKNIKWLQINQMALASADAFPDKNFKHNLSISIRVLIHNADQWRLSWISKIHRLSSNKT